MILVVIEAGDADRVSEGVRAAVGLGLRGDAVAVVLTGEAARFVAGGVDGGDPRIERGLRTLVELGRPARMVDAAELAERVRAARAVEVWTSPGASGEPRRVWLGPSGDPESGAATEVWSSPPRFRRAGRAIDAAELVAQILGSDGPVLVR